jgi:hypothetical protein
MKKYLFLLTLLVILLFCKAPDIHARFGLQAGIDRTSIENFDPDDLLTSRLGYNVGMYIEAPLSDNLSINPAFLFCLSGAKMKDSPSNLNTFYNLHYLEVPLTLSYRIHLIEDWLSVLPMAGVYGRIRLGAERVNQWRPDPEDLESDGMLSLNYFDAGLAAGGIVEIGKKLQISIEYQRGFVKVFDNEIWGKRYGNNSGLRISLRMFFSAED